MIGPRRDHHTNEHQLTLPLWYFSVTNARRRAGFALDFQFEKPSEPQ